MMYWGACRKQLVVCTLLFPDGRTLTGTNRCRLSIDHTDCNRVIAGSASGQDYDLCGPPVHAEEDVLNMAYDLGRDTEGAVAFLEGHTYYCPDCQQKLVDAGVRCFNIVE